MDDTRPGLRRRLRYRFDNAFSRGTGALVSLLAVFTLLLVVAAGLVLSLASVQVGEAKGDFLESFWASLLRTLDPGTMGGDSGWGFRAVSLAVTVGGIFIVSALIGFISSGIDRKLAELRKGRTPVVENGHTLILGWSPKLATVISEFVVANENLHDACVVVVAPRDKVEMEDEIRRRVELRGPTRLVCRTGDPTDPADLEIANVPGAKAVVVLSPDDDVADAAVVKTVLALRNADPGFAHTRVVAEFAHLRNARALRAAVGDRVATVVSTDVIARITALVCRQSGISLAYQELLDFDGDEIYFQPEPLLEGKTYGQALLAYDDSAVMGVAAADGTITLNPPVDRRFAPGDQVIAVSADDDTVVVSDPDPPEVVPDGDRIPEPAPEEHVLVVGWNALAPAILHQLDHYVAPGSTVRALVDPALVRPGDLDVADAFGVLRIEVTEADTTEPEHLARALQEQDFDHLVVLSYRREIDPSEADARTLMSLLQLHQFLAENPEPDRRMNIASELLDVRAVELARGMNTDDFIVSDQLTSLLLAQLAENPDLLAVFDDLFDPGGTEMSLETAAAYVPVGESIAFAEAVAAGARRGETVIGYRDASGVGGLGRGIHVNPRKSTPVVFGPDDELLVLGHAGVREPSPSR